MLTGLVCVQCGAQVPVGSFGRCPACGGILEPHYPEEALKVLAAATPGPGLTRYQALLPVAGRIPFLGEGDTPLIRSQRIGPTIGLRNLYFKNEGRNPSGAFKDRVGAMVTGLALDAGKVGVLTASSGNSASAISAYCAAAGLGCVILLEPGNPPNKLRQALATGARVVPVKGIFGRGPDELAGLLAEVAARLNYYLGFVWAPINPYALEGIKTIAYEVAARLPGAPDVVVAPVGGGDMLAAQWRGYRELQRAGVTAGLPRMIGVQSESAPPLLEAFRSGVSRVPTLPYARSKISGINVPFTGDHALLAVRESGGFVAGIQDDDATEMQARLGREEGLWVEPAGAAPVAALAGLLAQGRIRPEETVVCVCSGAGFKDSALAQDAATQVGAAEPVLFDPAAIAAAVR